MITSDYYEKDFQEFLHYKKYDSLENKIDFLKSFDFEKYNVENKKVQGTIIGEVKAWRKFHSNNSRKANLRDFEPFLTQGDIADFISGQLKFFAEDGNLIPLDEILIKILTQKISIIKKARTLEDSIRQSALLFRDIKNLFSDEKEKVNVEVRWSQFLTKAKTQVNVNSLLDGLKKGLPLNIRKILDKNSEGKLIEFLFDNLNNKYTNLISPDGLSKMLMTEWKTFLRNNLFGENKPIRSKQVFDTVIKIFNDYENDFKNVKEMFRFQFSDLISKAVNNELNRFSFGTMTKRLVRIHGRSAFRNGILMLGLNPKEYMVLEQLALNLVSNEAEKYVNLLAGKIFDQGVSLGNILIKEKLWTNKIIVKMWEFGKVSADRNGLYEWVYGDTKHCASCLKANGQRHRLIHWYQAGILPQSNGHKELICKGFHCECKLVKVTGTAIGRLDRIPMAS